MKRKKQDDLPIIGLLNQFLKYQSHFLYEWSLQVFHDAECLGNNKPTSVFTAELRKEIKKRADSFYDHFTKDLVKKRDSHYPWRSEFDDPHKKVAFQFLLDSFPIDMEKINEIEKNEVAGFFDHFVDLRTLATIYDNFYEFLDVMSEAEDAFNFLIEINAYRDYLMMSVEETIGYNAGKKMLTQFHKIRTSSSAKTKQERKNIKERYVWNEYLKIARENKDTQFMKLNKIAEKIKDSIKDDLKKHGIKSISDSTIEDIIRKKRRPQS